MGAHRLSDAHEVTVRVAVQNVASRRGVARFEGEGRGGRVSPSERFAFFNDYFSGHFSQKRHFQENHFSARRAPTTGAMRSGMVHGALLVVSLALLVTHVPDRVLGGIHVGGIDMSALNLEMASPCEVGDDGCEVVSPLVTVEVSGSLVDELGLPRAPQVVNHENVGTMQTTQDVFFVWLVHDPESFWVNLSPTESDRVIDVGLGQTQAGKVLLEADLLLKRTAAQLLHPDHPLGNEFWKKLYGWVGTRPAKLCHSFRQWIVPGVARLQQAREEVFDDDGASREDGKTDSSVTSKSTSRTLLHVLHAPLFVRQESAYVSSGNWSFSTIASDADGAAREMCAGSDPNARDEASRLFELLILPELEKQVNEAPEYQDLRSVYLWRVVSEFYREGGVDQHGEEENGSEKGECNATSEGKVDDGETLDEMCVDNAFAKRDKNKKHVEELVKVLRAGDMRNRWRRATDDKWTPDTVWDKYVTSAAVGEFSVTRDVTEKSGDVFRRSYFHGGVDWRHVRVCEVVIEGGVAHTRWCDECTTRGGLETPQVSHVSLIVSRSENKLVPYRQT